MDVQTPRLEFSKLIHFIAIFLCQVLQYDWKTSDLHTDQAYSCIRECCLYFDSIDEKFVDAEARNVQRCENV